MESLIWQPLTILGIRTSIFFNTPTFGHFAWCITLDMAYIRNALKRCYDRIGVWLPIHHDLHGVKRVRNGKTAPSVLNFPRFRTEFFWYGYPIKEMVPYFAEFNVGPFIRRSSINCFNNPSKFTFVSAANTMSSAKADDIITLVSNSYLHR